MREFIRDMLYEHEYGWYCSGETAPAYYGLTADERTKERKKLEWRCGCGWTTLDHHNGKSEWIDHADHVSERIVQSLRSRTMLDRIIKAATGYPRD